MKTLKLLVAAAAAVMMALGAQGAAERVKVKLLNVSDEPARGYWVEYEINGMKFRSDQTGSRINAIAWNAMNADDKEKTVLAVYGVGDARRLQFGDETARKMGDWYDLRKGWKNGKTILVEKLVEKDFPGLTARFGNFGAYNYYVQNFKPECCTGFLNQRYAYTGDCPDKPEMNAQLDLCKYYICDLAASAYTALENAEYLRTAAAVKSTAGDLIQLICDKCLVPAVSPGINGGIGLFAAPDAVGTAIDYFNSLTGWQGLLEESVIGKRANATDALEVIQHMTSAIQASYGLIKDCTARAHELQNAVDARHKEWDAAKKTRRENVDSDALVLKYRDYAAAGEVIRVRGVATAAIAEMIANLKKELDARQKEFFAVPADNVEAKAAAEAAWNAAQKAYNDYFDGMCASIVSRANAWKSTCVDKVAALRTSGVQTKAPTYPGAGTAWNGGALYDSMKSYTAAANDVDKAVRELKDYADKMEACHFHRRDLGEEMLALADELVESGQSIYNDYLAVDPDGGYGDLTRAVYALKSFRPMSTIPFEDLAIEEDDLFYRADPKFMEDVRTARSYAKLCENYGAALATRQSYQNAQNAFREKIEKGVIASKAAYETANGAYESAKAAIPGYVKEQQYYPATEPGFSSAGYCLNNKGVDTELRRKFVDATGSATLADTYRNDLNANVAGFTAKLLEREDAYRAQYYQESVQAHLNRSTVHPYGRYLIDSGDDFQKLQNLQEDFNGHPYSHRVMVGALGKLDQTQEAFVKNASASIGEGSDYVLNRIWSDSSFYSGTSKFQDAVAQVRTAAALTAAPSTKYDSMGSGSYAYHALNYYEGMNLPVKNPHETLVQPLYDEIINIRAKVKSGQVDPTWQLKLVKNDGTSVSTNLTCCYGIPRRMPMADDLQWAKPGHVLKGWGATSNATVVAFLPDSLITNSTTRSVTKTYYAMWTLANETHTLTCDPMGGVRQTTKFTVTVGKSAYSTIGVATRKGFKFLGWYNEEEDGIQVFDASGTAVKGTAYWDAKGNWIYEADVTVYARWSVDPNAYVIRFHKCDGTGLTREVGFVYGTSTALPTCAGGLGWKNDSGLFKGWATSIENAAKGIVWQKDGVAVSTAAAKGKTLDVYAVWETPVIRFVAGGGSGSMAPLYMGANEVRKLPKCTFTPPAGKKAFAGWAGSNGRRYDDEMLVFNLGSVTMTAIWK